MRKRTQVHIFSLKRIVLSFVLGFLLPLGYAFILSETFDYIGKIPPDFLVMPFGWPRPLWIFLMGRQPSEADLLSGLIFVALCNVLLYGAITYSILLAISAARHRPTVYDPPPPPEHLH
jgi:hypothetical protein